jgi:hypothetical protein
MRISLRLAEPAYIIEACIIYGGLQAICREVRLGI